MTMINNKVVHTAKGLSWHACLSCKHLPFFDEWYTCTKIKVFEKVFITGPWQVLFIKNQVIRIGVYNNFKSPWPYNLPQANDDNLSSVEKSLNRFS